MFDTKPEAKAADEPAEQEKPADAPAPKKPAVEDDPFGAVTPREQPTRLWVDETGTFQIQARLVQVLDGKVRLLKETGKFTTVPMNRLSPADRQYVEDYVAQFAGQTVGKVAGR